MLSHAASIVGSIVMCLGVCAQLSAQVYSGQRLCSLLQMDNVAYLSVRYICGSKWEFDLCARITEKAEVVFLCSLIVCANCFERRRKLVLLCFNHSR